MVIARLLRARGNKGEVAAEPLSDCPGRFENLRRVFIGGTEYAIERVWRHGAKLVFRFAGVGSIAQAQALAGRDVSVPLAERAPLEDGAYFQSDLIGCELFEAATGERVGMVKGWREYGGPALLEVEGAEGKEILIPFAKSICVRVDVAAKRIDAVLPEGLKDLDRP